MSTYENAPVKYITVNNIKFAYLLVGPLSTPTNGATTTTSVPLVMNVHFRGTFDHWDPLLINALAANRIVILIDNAGVGKSGGEIPEQFAGWAKHIIDVTLALGFTEVDTLGFSMGGFAAQLIALDGPKAGLKVRRLIVAGSGPSQGEGTSTGAGEYFQQLYVAKTEEENREGFLRTFFSGSDKKQQVGQEWWDRMTKARKDRSDYVGEEGTNRQTAAVMKWAGGEDRENGSYDRLHLIKIPVLVANGS
jgi:pimeloyl-ACP methyl ester carboxylesterase